MCLMCEGYSEQEVLDEFGGRVRRKGWMTLGVDAWPRWAYTIGLSATFDHPELIVVHPSLDKDDDLIGHAVDEIAEGRRFDEDSIFEIPCGGMARFERVHDDNLRGEWFTRWSDVSAAAGHETTLSSALQLIIACDCRACRGQVRLRRPRRHVPPGRRGRHVR
ncbi:MAG: DUF4262 domain-containing protein [Acidimicrobiales bacterium]|nr:DUF4262 domain-containing protein [Acidimicrobiales bacterium]